MLFRRGVLLLCSVPRRRLTSILNFQFKEYCTSMNNAYIWYTSGAPQFKCTFKYSNEKLNIERTFNFNRSSSENVSTFTSRVCSSVQSIIKSKASKKVKKKKLETGHDSTKDEEIAVVADLLKGGHLVSGEEQCSNILDGNEKLTLQLMGIPYDIVINAPWVTSLSIPKTILSDCPLYPKINTDSAKIEDSVFLWYKSENSKDWYKVAEGFCYTPQKEDIGHFIKLECIPKRGHMSGPKVAVASVNKIEPYPGPCPFEQRHVFTTERALGNSLKSVGNLGVSFRVVSYNILAALYADTETARIDLFRQCPPYAMEMSYRKQLLLKEIQGYQGDIMCLQEVDKSVFEDDLVPFFDQAGYECILNCKAGNIREGLACFIDKNRFQLLSSSSTILMEYLKSDPEAEPLKLKLIDNEVVYNNLIERNNVLQSCVVKSLDLPNEVVVIGNIHLYFHPTADHIRLIQAELALTRLRALLEDVHSTYPDCRVSLLFCGDFNSTPECGVYRLMTTGNVSADAEDWRSRENEVVEGIELTHPLQLGSACGTPDFTNYTIEFKGCLDYIYYQTDRFEVKQVVPLPSEDELKIHTALPSVVCPSDHIALISDLAWKSRQ